MVKVNLHLVPDHRGKALVFPIEIILVVGLPFMAFMMLRYVQDSYFVEGFYKDGCCILSNVVSAFIERIIGLFSFLF